LEKRTKIDAVEIRWPSGAVEKLTNVPINSFINIEEGENRYRKR
jgi:hypothetical protein